MTLHLSSFGRMIRATLAPIFLAALFLGCGPSDAGTISAGTKEEASKGMLPKLEGKAGAKLADPQGGASATPPSRKKK
jgi:hypothetical protein